MKKVKQMRQKIGVILLAMMTLNFTGCAMFEPPPVKYLPNDASMIALNGIAEKAQQSTAVLAEMQAQNKGNAHRASITYSHRRYKKSYQTNTIQDSFQKSDQKVSFSFEGPVNIALQKLSAKAGYQFMMGGSQAKINPVSSGSLISSVFPKISVIESNTPLSTIVLRINQQLPANMKVICYPKTKSLLLIFKSTGV